MSSSAISPELMIVECDLWDEMQGNRVEGYVLRGARLGVAGPLVLRGPSLQVTVAVLHHRVIIQPLAH